jgi:glutamate/aspartate transport system substrate-binding protein
MRLLPLAFAAAMFAVPALAAELTGTLQKVKETGTITLGVRDSSVPFSYLDDNQKPVGYAIDICTQIVEAVKKELAMPGLKVATVPVLSSNRIPLMANGTIDLECGSTTNNVKRQEQVWFTNSHYLTASMFVAKKSSNLTKIADLAGKTVVSTAGSTNIVQLNQANAERKLGITVVPAKDHAEAFLMVETDRAVAFVMDDIILASFIASSKDPSAYALGSEAFSAAEPYGIMLRKDDVPFKALADKATAAFYLSAAGKANYAKWFQSPIPPKGLNLNTAMSKGLQYEYAHPTDSADPAFYNQ